MKTRIAFLSKKYSLSVELTEDFCNRVIDLNNLDRGIRMLKSGRFPYEVVPGGINIRLWRHIIAIELWNRRRNNVRASIGLFSVVMLALKEIKIDYRKNLNDPSRRGTDWKPLIAVLETAVKMELNEEK